MKRLKSDPIVQQLTHDVRQSGDPISAFAHDNGTPRNEFMHASNQRYRELGGTDGGHLGAIANAVLALAYEEDED